MITHHRTTAVVFSSTGSKKAPRMCARLEKSVLRRFLRHINVVGIVIAETTLGSDVKGCRVAGDNAANLTSHTADNVAVSR